MFLISLLALIVVPWFFGIVCIFKVIFGKKLKGREYYAKELEMLKIQKISDLSMMKGYEAAIEDLRAGINTEVVSNDDLVGKDQDVIEDRHFSSISYINKNSKKQEDVGMVENDIDIEGQDEKHYSVDNANILLYLGSFLVVVAAGIFVGFNYQLLSDIAKVWCFYLFLH